MNIDIDENYSPTFKNTIQRSTFSPVPFMKNKNPSGLKFADDVASAGNQTIISNAPSSMSHLIKLKEYVNNFVRYMQEAQDEEKTDTTINIKKVTELQEI